MRNLLSAGNSVVFENQSDAEDISSGVYYLRLKSREEIDTNKLLLLI